MKVKLSSVLSTIQSLQILSMCLFMFVFSVLFLLYVYNLH